MIIVATAVVIIVGTAIAWFPRVGIVGLLFFVAVDWERPYWAPVTSVAGLGISILDGFVLCLVASMAVRSRGESRAVTGSVINYAILSLCLVMATSLVRGILGQPVGAVASESRSWVYLAVVFAWFLLMHQRGRLSASDLAFLARGIVIALSTMALLHLFFYGIGAPDQFVVGPGGEQQTSRILVSGQAVLILAAGLVIVANGRERTIDRILLGWAIVIMTLSQHRSVWAAASVGLFVLMAGVVIDRRARRFSGVRRVLLPALMLAVLATAVFGRELLDVAQREFSNRSTYDDRTSSWTFLVDQSIARGWSSIFFGASTGSGWDRPGPNFSLITYQPHNWYVTIYLRAGLIGLTLLMIVVAGLLIASIRARRYDCAAIIALIATYCWAYGLTWYLAPMLAFVLISVGSDKRPPEAPRELTDVERSRGVAVR